jgi:hypothetical protein
LVYSYIRIFNYRVSNRQCRGGVSDHRGAMRAWRLVCRASRCDLVLRRARASVCPSGAATAGAASWVQPPARPAGRRTSPVSPPLIGVRTGDYARAAEAASPIPTVHAPPRRGGAWRRPRSRLSNRMGRNRPRESPGNWSDGGCTAYGCDAAGRLGIAGMSRPRSAPQRRHENRLLVKATRVR